MKLFVLVLFFISGTVRADGLVNYLYDMGAVDSKVAAGYTLVVLDDAFSGGRGYGFTTRVSGAFELEGFSRTMLFY